MIVEDMKFDIANTPSASTYNTKTGYDVDGVIGYDLGMFRLETEVGYKFAKGDTYRSSINTPFVNTGSFARPGEYDSPHSHTSALSFMVNGLLDFGDDDAVQGFVVGGVGVARVTAAGVRAGNAAAVLDDSDTVFAWQGIAGVRAPLSSHVDLSLKYRFFNADNVKLVGVEGAQYETRYRSHSLLGGLTYNFGEPTPPPPPPAPPAPPPPPEAPVAAPPAPVCSPGPFIVFFEWDKSDITPEASSILDNAVAQYASCGNAQVMLAGFADRSGTPKYNVGLSQRRADAVKAYLSSHSIPDSVVTTQAFGEDPSHLRVQTADGVREVQNRRVEITYGPGSGQ